MLAEEHRLGDHGLLDSSTSTRSFGPWMFANPSVAPKSSFSASGTACAAPHEWDRAARRDQYRLLPPQACSSRRSWRPTPGRPVAAEAVARLTGGGVRGDAERAHAWRCRTTAACASAASCSGWTAGSTPRGQRGDRIDRPSTDGASMPVTVIAGPVQIRSPMPPLPSSGHPSSTSASSRIPARCGFPVHCSRRRPSTATSPSRRERGEGADQGHRASGAMPP